MNKYIGIDISKATLDVYDGKESHRFSNTPRGFKAIAKLSPKEEACWIFEPTGIYSYGIVHYCQEHQIKAAIVGSKVARDYARSIKQRSKTDKIDAKVLYRYHTQVAQEEITVPSLDTKALQLTQRRNVEEKYRAMVIQLKNLLEATDPKDTSLRRSLNKQIKALQKAADKIAEQAEELLCADEENVLHLANLQTIPGIGKKSALAILLEVMRYPEATSKKMVALMGLDPVLKESGVFKGKSRISKQGGGSLRKKLYFAAIVATQHNEPIRVFYERLVSRGKSKKLAVLAAMRKLLVMALAVIRKREVYRPAI